MAWTTYFKNQVAANEFQDSTKYVGLAIDGTELTGNGYARAAWLTTEMTLANDTSVITNSAIIVAYTPTTDSAQDADEFAIFDAVSGGNQLTDWEDLTSDVAAPELGQRIQFPVDMLSITV